MAKYNIGPIGLRFIVDTAILVVIAVFSYILAIEHGTIFILLTFLLMLCFLAFAMRRWMYIKHELIEQKKIEAELAQHHNHLEEMVRDRTDEVVELNKKIEFILGATKTGLDIIDSDYNIVYIDHEWQKLYGDPKGKKCYEYFMGKRQPCPGCGVKTALETKKPIVTEEILVKEGNRPIQVTTIPYKDEKGNWLVAEINIDIAERKQKEKELEKYRDHLELLVEERTKALKDSEAKFKTVFDDGRDGILLVDTDTKRFSMCNKAICKMLGYSEEEIKQLCIDDIHAKKDLPYVLKQFNSLAREEIRIATDIPTKRKDGSIFYADISASLLEISGEKYIMGSFRDMTERKKTLDDLAKSEASYRAIFESANDAIFIRDIKKYEIVDVNDKACEMLCYPKQELLGLGLDAVAVNSDQYNAERLKEIYNKASEGQPQVFEWLVRDKFGREFWTEVSLKRAIVGREYRLLSVTRDITDRKQLMDIKDNFVNMVSHELRTPLSAIKESISLVIDDLTIAADEEKRKCLEIAKKNVDRLGRLIDNILDVQKLESGKMAFEMKENDMNEVVQEVHRTMLSLAGRNKLSFNTKLEKKLPEAIFDRDKIVQVLTNLVNNSIKFTKKGGISITTDVSGNCLTVSVKDTGVGVSKDFLPKIFDKFEQLGKAVNGTKGTGLGLAICKEIIEKHKGRIWAESEPGKGTTISFILPIRERRG